MTPEAQRIAIAEACGYKWEFDKDGWCFWLHPQGHFLYKSVFPTTFSKGERIDDLPDYLSDLNAMHDAEKVLTTTRLQNDYQTNLAEITYADAERAHNQVVFNQLTATAAQRAEAFLRTLGKWVEEEWVEKECSGCGQLFNSYRGKFELCPECDDE